MKNGGNRVKGKITLHAKVEPKAQIIDSRCSNHMTRDKGKVFNLAKYDGGSMKFAIQEVVPICGK